MQNRDDVFADVLPVNKHRTDFADSDSDSNRSDWFVESAPIHTPTNFPIVERF